MRILRACLMLLLAAGTTEAQQDKTDVPKDYAVKQVQQDFTTRVEMIPMRDGVKLKTFIFIPKGANNAPILLERTPYNAAPRQRTVAADLIFQAGYIRVFQDVRGKYGSEGDYLMGRPVR